MAEIKMAHKLIHQKQEQSYTKFGRPTNFNDCKNKVESTGNILLLQCWGLYLQNIFTQIQNYAAHTTTTLEFKQLKSCDDFVDIDRECRPTFFVYIDLDFFGLESTAVCGPPLILPIRIFRLRSPHIASFIRRCTVKKRHCCLYNLTDKHIPAPMSSDNVGFLCDIVQSFKLQRISFLNFTVGKS